MEPTCSGKNTKVEKVADRTQFDPLLAKAKEKNLFFKTNVKSIGNLWLSVREMKAEIFKGSKWIYNRAWELADPLIYQIELEKSIALLRDELNSLKLEITEQKLQPTKTF